MPSCKNDSPPHFRYTNAIEKKYYKAIDTSSRHDHYPQLIDMDSATTKKRDKLTQKITVAEEPKLGNTKNILQLEL